MGLKHKRFREFWTAFPLPDTRETPRSNECACAAGDSPICSKNRKIVPYHEDNPNTRNGARLRSPSPIMAPDYYLEEGIKKQHKVMRKAVRKNSQSMLSVVIKSLNKRALNVLTLDESTVAPDDPMVTLFFSTPLFLQIPSPSSLCHLCSPCLVYSDARKTYQT